MSDNQHYVSPVLCACGVTLYPNAEHSLEKLRKAFCLCDSSTSNTHATRDSGEKNS